MDKIKTVKIKELDGSISEETYTIATDAINVDMENGYNLQETIGTININKDGSVAEQLVELDNNKINMTDIIDNLNSTQIDKVLSANQGKVLGDVVAALEIESVKKKAYFFDTVADMKAANLKDGDYACTLGYYSVNDGGRAIYKIVEEESETDYQEGLENGLYVTLIMKNNTVNVKQIGAYGDGSTDDTSIIQNALDNFTNIFIPDGTYMINAITSLNIPSNKNIKLSKNAILKAITNSNTNYNIVKIYNKQNINIEGGIIQGDRATHTSEEGEWGMGISILNNSSNINISNITIKDCWGDGIYINKGKNITTTNVICDNNRRQGLSIINVDGYHSLNDKFINTNGTAPQSGVDIEPNKSNDILKNIIFDNPYTYNNVGKGIDMFIFSDNNTNVDITVNNHYDEDSRYGLSISKNADLGGQIIINNPTYIHSQKCGILLQSLYYGDCKVIINNPYILDCNTDGDTAQAYNCGISCFTTSETTDHLGNLIINNPYITMTDKVNTARYIYVVDQINSLKAKDISIINPRNRQSNLNIMVINGIDNLLFKDENNLFHFAGNSNYTISNSNLFAYFSNENYSANRILTLADDLSIGYEITFRRLNPSYNLDVQFPSNQYLKFLSNDAAIKVRIGMGCSLTIKKISSTEWIVTDVVGTPTVVS